MRGLVLGGSVLRSAMEDCERVGSRRVGSMVCYGGLERVGCRKVGSRKVFLRSALEVWRVSSRKVFLLSAMQVWRGLVQGGLVIRSAMQVWRGLVL